MLRLSSHSALFHFYSFALVACGGISQSQSNGAGPSGGTTGNGIGGGGGIVQNTLTGNGGPSIGEIGGTGTALPREGPIGCMNPAAHMDEGTGFVTCEGGFMHRPTVGACTLHPPSSEVLYPSNSLCSSDADCTNIERGLCAYITEYGIRSCQSECATDSDCSVERACLCGSEFNRCVQASCTTDAACGTDLLCASHANTCSRGEVAGFACQTSDDACTRDAACQGPKGLPQVCAPSKGARACLGAGACGAS